MYEDRLTGRDEVEPAFIVKWWFKLLFFDKVDGRLVSLDVWLHVKWRCCVSIDFVGIVFLCAGAPVLTWFSITLFDRCSGEGFLVGPTRFWPISSLFGCDVALLSPLSLSILGNWNGPWSDWLLMLLSASWLVSLIFKIDGNEAVSSSNGDSCWTPATFFATLGDPSPLWSGNWNMFGL